MYNRSKRKLVFVMVCIGCEIIEIVRRRKRPWALKNSCNISLHMESI